MPLTNPLLNRYWVNVQGGLGYGVTAYSESDAIELAKEVSARLNRSFQVLDVMENIDINTLDHGHILPNMGLVTVRGVWFPNVQG